MCYQLHQSIMPCNVHAFVEIASIQDVCDGFVVMGGRMENAMWVVAGGIPSGQVRFCREYLEAGFDGKDENILADRRV